MSSGVFARKELAAAVARGVRQCVVIGSRLPSTALIRAYPDIALQVFEVDEAASPEAFPATFIPTQFTSESLSTALEKSRFDKFSATLVVWLGGAGYRTAEAAYSTLAFIASLPRGSGVVFDYTAERPSLDSLTQTALDAFASRMALAGDTVKLLVQPQAVTGMLRGLGFRHILDLALEEASLCQRHLVSAII